MKSKILKCAIVASSLAFMNCSDDASLPAINNPESLAFSSSFDGGDGLSSSAVTNPDMGGMGPGESGAQFVVGCGFGRPCV